MGRGNISIIVAMDNQHAIGSNGVLPWHLRADMKRFKKLTLGKPIIMGRKTYQSIGRPLPRRKNIVLTRNKEILEPGYIWTHTLEEALLAAGNVEEIIVIGGADIYRLLLPQANQIYLTEVHADTIGDVYFPELDRDEWIEREREQHAADTQNDFDYSFVRLDKRR